MPNMVRSRGCQIRVPSSTFTSQNAISAASVARRRRSSLSASAPCASRAAPTLSASVTVEVVSIAVQKIPAACPSSSSKGV
jgi:hypothetical protein